MKANIIFEVIKLIFLHCLKDIFWVLNVAEFLLFFLPFAIQFHVFKNF